MVCSTRSSQIRMILCAMCIYLNSNLRLELIISTKYSNSTRSKTRSLTSADHFFRLSLWLVSGVMTTGKCMRNAHSINDWARRNLTYKVIVMLILCVNYLNIQAGRLPIRVCISNAIQMIANFVFYQMNALCWRFMAMDTIHGCWLAW